MIGKKVLVIDDDPELCQLVSLIFKKAGAQANIARDGLEGISKLFTFRPDLIILDVMMPKIDGVEICKRIRYVSDVPLIMLTALNHEQQMLHGLEAGADDYLSKPFNADILLARAKTVLRRVEQPNGHNNGFEYNDGYLRIDYESHHVLIKGKRTKLTPIEFRLLVYLARNAGKVLTFQQILTNVWGQEYQGSIDYVHVYISHLRGKIEKNPKDPNYILTVHGVGYIFREQELIFKP